MVLLNRKSRKFVSCGYQLFEAYVEDYYFEKRYH